MHTNSEISLDVLLSESVSVSPSPSNQSRDQTLWTSGPALSGDLLIDSLQNRCLICHLSLSIRLPGRRSGSSRTAPGAPDCPQRSGLPPALREQPDCPQRSGLPPALRTAPSAPGSADCPQRSGLPPALRWSSRLPPALREQPDCPQRSVGAAGLPPALRESGSPQTATITTPACRGSL